MTELLDSVQFCFRDFNVVCNTLAGLSNTLLVVALIHCSWRYGVNKCWVSLIIMRRINICPHQKVRPSRTGCWFVPQLVIGDGLGFPSHREHSWDLVFLRVVCNTVLCISLLKTECTVYSLKRRSCQFCFVYLYIFVSACFRAVFIRDCYSM